MSYNEIISWADRGPVDALYPQDDWNPLLYTAAVGEVEAARYLLSQGAEVNFQTQGKVLPQLTALHIAVRAGNLEMVKLLAHHGDANRQDQWGFTPIHYATIARNKDIVAYLLSNGASATLASRAKTTALDMARELKFDDIMDLLASKSTLELDPTLPQFRAWLCHLGAGEYLPRFVDSGYDLRFIAKGGLSHEDLDAVGIPSMEKRYVAPLPPFFSSLSPPPTSTTFPTHLCALVLRQSGVCGASSSISGSSASSTRPRTTTTRARRVRTRMKRRRRTTERGGGEGQGGGGEGVCFLLSL